jgi:hypothetical protein
MNNYQLIHFKVQEFVDKDTYNKRGDASISCIDWRMLWTMDSIRDYFRKPITINNWHIGKEREWSGIRFVESQYYSKLSQHSFGRAIDFIVSGIDSAEVRKTIRDNPNEDAFKYITTLEDFSGMSWIHIDCRVLRSDQSRFLIVEPNK